MGVSSINSYDSLYLDRFTRTKGNEHSAGESGVIGPTSDDMTQSAKRSGNDTFHRATAPRSTADQTSKGDSEVLKLKKRDAEVRAHEQAHLSAGSQYVRGGAKYEYTTGPDGRKYVIGGEVSIDTAPVPDDPRSTIQKMQVVKRAALAPSQPSPQDQQVASAADRAANQARMELIRKTTESMESATAEGRLEKGTKVDIVV